MFTLLGGLPVGLLFSSPFFLCGIICLTAAKHPGLWCLWAVFLTADAYLRYATGLSWATVRWTLQWTWEMNYTRLVIAWCQLLCALALLAWTVRTLGREPLERTPKNRRLFWAGWALFALLCLPLSAPIIRAGGTNLWWLVHLIGCLQDFLRLALLAGLLTCLRRWRRDEVL